MIVISRTENRENANFGTPQGNGILKSTCNWNGKLRGCGNEGSVVALSTTFRPRFRPPRFRPPRFSPPRFSPPRIVRLRAYRPIDLCLGIEFDRLVSLPVDRVSP